MHPSQVADQAPELFSAIKSIVGALAQSISGRVKLLLVLGVTLKVPAADAGQMPPMA